MNAFGIMTFIETLTPDRLIGWAEFGLSAIIVLGLLIIVHECGHFITGRLVGVRVEKFSIGFGPQVWGKTIGSTEYMISWIPLGGYVKFYGDEPDAEVEDQDESFFNQVVWKRLLIVAAGPFSNLALAIIIVALAAMIGLPEGSRIIDEVMKDSPAQQGGLLPGDRIDAIDGVEMATWKDVQTTIRKSPGESLSLDIYRESGARVELIITPKEHKGVTIDGKEMTIGQIGVMPRQITKQYPPHLAVVKGVTWTWDVTVLTFWAISKLITREIPADQIAGPIGIMKMAGQAAKTGFESLLLFIGLISVNLGILNLLPIPVLDGGHILFFSIEAALGKPLKLRHQELAQQVGIFMLISLMALAFYNDIARMISG